MKGQEDHARHRRYLAYARALGPAVERGAFQHFYVREALPRTPATPNVVAEAWRNWVSNPMRTPDRDPLALYLHIPFCQTKCRYCNYFSIGNSGPGDLAGYLRRLHDEIDFWSIPLDGVAVSAFYMGGGTPTILDVASLRSILEHLGSRFARRLGGEWAFECSPLTLSEDKARLFEEFGFNRASFGVQSLRASVLDRANRGYQDVPRVRETFRILKACDFQINADLMYGLPGDSVQGALDSLNGLLEMDPDEVVIYGLSPGTPWEEALAGRRYLPSHSELAALAAGACRTLGYEIEAHDSSVKVTRAGSAKGSNRFTRDSRLPGGGTRYDDQSTQNLSVLAIGPSARSYIRGRMNYRALVGDVAAPFDPDSASLEARAFGPREGEAYYLAMRLCRCGGLQASDFLDRFGIGVEEVFGRELQAARRLGLIEQAEGVWHLVPETPIERFAAMMFLVDEQRIQAASQRFLEVEVGGQAIRVVLASVESGVPLTHSVGPHGYYVLGAQAEGDARLLEPLFRKLFNRVVAFLGGAPSLDEIEATLVSRGDGLRVKTPSGEGLHGSVLHIHVGWAGTGA